MSQDWKTVSTKSVFKSKTQLLLRSDTRVAAVHLNLGGKVTEMSVFPIDVRHHFSLKSLNDHF